MVLKLTFPVGRRCINRREDVQIVQRLLNLKRIPQIRPLREDGICGPLTLEAIEQFQRLVVRMAQPDGKIDPVGPTFHALSKALSTPVPVPVQVTNGATTVAWGAKVSPEFKTKVVQICADLGMNPDYLMSCMAFETGETFSPSVLNKAGSGATGLIQFMPSTAKALGTTTTALAAMTAVQQLDYVKQYFLPYRGRLKTLEDVYMAIFTPAAIGKPATHELYSEGSKAYTQNKGFDSNKDGKISLAEISSAVRRKYSRGMTPGLVG